MCTIINNYKNVEASFGKGAQSVTVKSTGYGFDTHSRKLNIKLNVYFHFFVLVSKLSAALSFANSHAMPPEYSMKLKKIYYAIAPYKMTLTTTTNSIETKIKSSLYNF